MNSPASQTALVTGASSGIGLELAKVLAAAKYSLVITARSPEPLEALAADLRRDGAQVTVITADLSTPDGAKSLLEEIKKRDIRIDLLINNAGLGTHGPFWKNDLEKEMSLLQVNVLTLAFLTHQILPGMIERGHGRILNVASTAAFQPGPLMANYYASKAYVLSFSEALSNELRRSGVTVTALCPGPTLTDFQRRAGIKNSKLFELTGMSAAQVAGAGFEAMLAGRRVCIPGFKNRLLVLASRFSPRRFVLRTVRKLNESRQNPD
jgi:short-subunit dehydrogenase